MVVQHNMQAMNANRMLGITAGQQAKSTEKLSSGYKINRAADNAAGLAISEKMRKQIRGLDQASSNAQDGISAVQTAEGALNEVQDMLQRMNELAVQSANGTNSVSDRKSIQDEIDQLATEIDRVSETTKFNEAYLLRGDNTAAKKFTFAYGAVAEDKSVGISFDDEGSDTGTDAATGLTVQVVFADLSEETSAAASDQNALAKSIRDQGFSVTKEIVPKVDETGVVSTTEGTETYTLSLNGESAKNYTVNKGEDEGSFEIVDAAGKSIATVTVAEGTLADSDVGKSQSAIITAKNLVSAEKAGDVKQFYDKDGNAISANALKDYFTATNEDGEISIMPRAGVKLYDAVGNAIDMVETAFGDEGMVVADQNLIGDLKLKLHVGADATKNNQITINLQAMSAKGLGVNGLRVDGADDSNALDAIETIKSALATVSAQRSELGAAQNRLEHTIANLDNIVENTTSAESSIRDTDMAEEMVRYSKSNILAQAGQSMLAQANQSNQGVLSLLG
ncbi:MAG: flagellar hook protein [Lachnospiraceae bacterium]|nr:flagellar hook protein [Lachnospiraceae bacterium]